jgi:uncharacterized membrane protein
VSENRLQLFERSNLMNPTLVPLEGHGPHGIEHGLSVLPFLSGLVLLLVLAALTAFYLHRQGKLSLPTSGGRRTPEDQARAILSDRLARGDISSEEFLERSSTLNWTPGSEASPARPRKKRR